MGDMKEYDVIVVGGGVVGTGVARDCAMRGLSVLLLEKKDFAGGTSGANMGMIHGGVRYLLYDVETTKLSCIDSGYIQRIAPHLLFRIPFITPVMKGDSHNVELVETFMEAYDVFQHYKGGRRHTRLSKNEALEVEPGLSDEINGAITFDEWGINPFRLCVCNALSAAGHGAHVRNHTMVTEFIRDGGAVAGVRMKDMFTGGMSEARARIVVNAGGPWAEKIAGEAGAEVRLRPGKGINIFFDRRISNYAVAAEAVDGRQVLIMPHENTTMMGCTDDDFYGDLDHLEATHDEIEYLFEALERVFPSIRKHRMIRVMTGVRPTLFEWRKIEDKLTREHEVFDHEAREGISGFITIVGGKLATFRIMAQETADLVCARLGVQAECRTHLEPLPGGDGTVDLEGIAGEFGMPLYVVKRLAFRHGTRCRDVLELVKENRRAASIVCRCDPVTEAEIRYVIRSEWARTLDDVRRRTHLGCGPCQGARCNFRAAAILGDELNLEPHRTWNAGAEYLQQRWKGKYPILRGEQLAQEEINQAIYFAVGNYDEICHMTDGEKFSNA